MIGVCHRSENSQEFFGQVVVAQDILYLVRTKVRLERKVRRPTKWNLQRKKKLYEATARKATKRLHVEGGDAGS